MNTNFYVSDRFDFLYYHFPHYAELTVRFITCTMEGEKIPFNKELEKTLFNMGLEFTKQKTKHIFQVCYGWSEDSVIEVSL